MAEAIKCPKCNCTELKSRGFTNNFRKTKQMGTAAVGRVLESVTHELTCAECGHQFTHTVPR